MFSRKRWSRGRLATSSSLFTLQRSSNTPWAFRCWMHYLSLQVRRVSQRGPKYSRSWMQGHGEVFKLFGATTSCGFVWFWKDVVPSRQTVEKGLLRSGHTTELKNLCLYISGSQGKGSIKCDMRLFGWTTIANYESGGVLACFLYCHHVDWLTLDQLIGQEDTEILQSSTSRAMPLWHFMCFWILNLQVVPLCGVGSVQASNILREGPQWRCDAHDKVSKVPSAKRWEWEAVLERHRVLGRSSGCGHWWTQR